MQEEYNKHDKYKHEYSSEKNTDKVVKEACDYFDKSEEEVLNAYNNFIYTQETVLKGFGETVSKDIDEASSLDGCKVKINVDHIFMTKQSQSGEAYLEFVRDNKDKEFIARIDKNVKSMLYLEGHEFWLFDNKDLIKID